MEKNYSLDFGIMSDSFEVQLKKQGLADNETELHEEVKKSIVILWFNGYITDNQKEKMIQKLSNNINKTLKLID